MEKLIAHGITTVEALADMTAEELSEIPGIGEKTVEKITVAVRHYFGQYEEGEERPAPPPASEPPVSESEEVSSMSPTPEEILAIEAEEAGSAEEVTAISTEDIAELEDEQSASDADSDADAREEAIETGNQTVDDLVNLSDEVSSETIDDDPGSRA
jgi:N utilization substance protein A